MTIYLHRLHDTIDMKATWSYHSFAGKYHLYISIKNVMGEHPEYKPKETDTIRTLVNKLGRWESELIDDKDDAHISYYKARAINARKGGVTGRDRLYSHLGTQSLKNPIFSGMAQGDKK